MREYCGLRPQFLAMNKEEDASQAAQSSAKEEAPTQGTDPSTPSAALANDKQQAGQQATSRSPADPSGAEHADTYRVSIPQFDGPLDLLLHLIRKHELDILDIPIAFITEKYTAYIRLMDQLNIDVASEYLLMVATLIHIKSRMLLPNSPDEDQEDANDEPEEDPRGELIRKLLEYQKYKNVAEQLGERRLLGNDVFPRGSTPEAAVGPSPLLQVSMFKLLDAFQGVLERTEQNQEHTIDFERISISDKISQLNEMLQEAGKLAFRELFSRDADRAELIITFLALLEMTKLRMTRLFQDGPFDEIFIELTVSDDDASEEDDSELLLNSPDTGEDNNE